MEEEIYKAIRQYQEGNLNYGCVATGCLDTPLSNLFNIIIMIIKEKK